jgi:hypothetical protein
MNGLVRPRRETLHAPVTLDASAPERTLAFVAWLRDLHADTVEVAWRAVIDPRLDTTLLHHLPPPMPPENVDWTDAVHRWQAAFRPAMCYYRLGPGFVQIKDVRQAETAARFLLDEPPLVAAFTRCLRPARITDLSPAEYGVAQTLVRERLLLRVGDWATTLPSRMRRWPVPSHLA